jgi:ubiquinone/menaquinone biosynthesis C-methylase UbiE
MGQNLLIKEKVTETYNEISCVYNLLTDLPERKTRQRILELAEVKNGQSILEVATGAGLIFTEIVKANPGGQNIGIDLSGQMLFQAEKQASKSGNNFSLEIGDAYNLSFEDNSFDLLINGYMLDILPENDFLPVLKGFHRVLKPGGKFVIANLYPQKNLFYFTWDILYKINPSIVGWCRGIKLLDSIKEAGFIVHKSEIIEQCGFNTQIISGIK